jgi:hypothetical protein
MFETAIVIGIVLLAVGGIGFALYRAAAGTSRCSGCSGCGRDPRGADSARAPTRER